MDGPRGYYAPETKQMEKDKYRVISRTFRIFKIFLKAHKTKLK